MSRFGARDEEPPGRPCCEPFGELVGKDPRVIRIADRVDGGESCCAVIGVVQPPGNLEFPTRAHDRLRSKAADLTGDTGTHLDRWLEHAVGTVKDGGALHPGGLACLTLFL